MTYSPLAHFEVIRDGERAKSEDSTILEENKPWTWAASEIPHFVPSWEGLRGIAVLMTTGSHILQGSQTLTHFLGSGGVSIFFVLSGFLITGILFDKQHKVSVGHPSKVVSYRHLGRFYIDRFSRLYPALLLMLTVTTIFTVTLHGWRMPDQQYFTQMMLVVFYLSDVNIGHSLWGNTWSLAVEEQFYIVWSLLLPYLLLERNRYARVILMSVLISVSFALHYCGVTGLVALPAWLTHYWSPFSTVYKMFLGAWLRLIPLPSWLYRKQNVWIGLLLIVATIVTALPSSQPIDLAYLGLSGRYFGHNVFHEPIAVLSALLIVVGSMENGNPCLESQALRFIGRVSYSLYLYQRPMQHLGNGNDRLSGAGLSSLAFVIAALSTMYVEEPIREWVRRRGSRAKR